MADKVDTTTAADPEVERVRAAAEEQPTVIVDDPDVTGAPEGEEVVTTATPDPVPAVESVVEEVTDAVEGVARTLSDLSRRELERLDTAVSGLLRGMGTEPEKEGPTLSEIASRLPVNEEATAQLGPDQVAGAFSDVGPGDLLTWKVRQKQDVEGNPTGPAYLRAVTRDGQKITAVHK